jgi:hypothetical protein
MIQTIARLLKNGPNKTDNTLIFIVGHWLWYRTWVFGFLLFLPLALGLLSLNYGSGSLGVFVTYFTFTVLSDKIDKYSINNAN